MGTTAEKLEDAKVTLANLRKEVEDQEWVVEQLTHILADETPWGWVATYEESDGKLHRQDVYAVAEGLRVSVSGFQVVIAEVTPDAVHARSPYEFATVRNEQCRCLGCGTTHSHSDLWLAVRRADSEFPEVWELTNVDGPLSDSID